MAVGHSGLGSPFYRRGQIVELGSHRGGHGSAKEQISKAFETLLDTLKSAGGQPTDLVAVYSMHCNLDDDDTSALCEAFQVAKIRPTWTTVGVGAFEDPDCLVEIRGKAYIGGEKQEFGTSDESKGFAQCVRVGHSCFVSGQYGQDFDSGQLPLDQLVQVTNALERVDRLIKQAGGSGWSDVAHYTSWSVGEYSAMIPQCRQLARESARLNPSQPCWTFLGAQTLRQGLVCVVPDAIDFTASSAPRHNPGAVGQRNSAEYKYEQAISFEEYVVISGQGAWNIDDTSEPLPTQAGEQVTAAFRNIDTVLESAGSCLNQVCALHVNVVGPLHSAITARVEQEIMGTWPENSSRKRPVISLTSVSTLAFPEMLIEIQASATK